MLLVVCCFTWFGLPPRYAVFATQERRARGVTAAWHCCLCEPSPWWRRWHEPCRILRLPPPPRPLITYLPPPLDTFSTVLRATFNTLTPLHTCIFFFVFARALFARCYS